MLKAPWHGYWKFKSKPRTAFAFVARYVYRILYSAGIYRLTYWSFPIPYSFALLIISFFACSLNTLLRIFPLALLGISSTNLKPPLNLL